MQASGTFCRSFLSPEHKPAVAALPFYLVLPFENSTCFHTFEKFQVAAFMEFLNFHDIAPGGSDLFEALFFSHLGKSRVPLGPLFVFAGSGFFQVLPITPAG